PGLASTKVQKPGGQDTHPWFRFQCWREALRWGRTQDLLLVCYPLGGVSWGVWAMGCPPALYRGGMSSSLEFLFCERPRTQAPPQFPVVSGPRGEEAGRAGAVADPRFPAGSMAQDGRLWLQMQESVMLTATGSGKGLSNSWMLQRPQTTQIAKCRGRPRANSNSLGTPRPTPAPWTSETPGGGTTENTFFGLREVPDPHTHILIPETLESTHPKNLSCSVSWACEWGTHPIFSCTSAALTSLGPRTRLCSVVTLTPWPQDRSTNLICQVMFPAASVMVERPSSSTSPMSAGPGRLGPSGSLPQVSLVFRGARDQDRSDSGGHQGSWCHSTARSLPLPHLLHSEDPQEESSQDSSGIDDIHPAIGPAS
ncbi:hypothetical protein HPG69_014067, partial [Diceros bicornis minor]